MALALSTPCVRLTLRATAPFRRTTTAFQPGTSVSTRRPFSLSLRPRPSAMLSSPRPLQRRLASSTTVSTTGPAAASPKPTNPPTAAAAAATSQPSRPAASRASSASPASPAPPASSMASLTWNDYLALRTKRRRLNLVFSVVTAAAATGAGASVLTRAEAEGFGQFGFGMDPVFVLGAATAACGMVGWLVGPFIGGGAFNVAYRRVARQMRDKETEFYRRIRKNRSDPAGQSVNNPVPDYYGEKITSVRDYRRWLKDQRAFRRKREVNVI